MWPNIDGGHHSGSGYSMWLPGSSATRYRESVRPKISAVGDRRVFGGIGHYFRRGTGLDRDVQASV